MLMLQLLPSSDSGVKASCSLSASDEPISLGSLLIPLYKA